MMAKDQVSFSPATRQGWLTGVVLWVRTESGPLSLTLQMPFCTTMRWGRYPGPVVEGSSFLFLTREYLLSRMLTD